MTYKNSKYCEELNTLIPLVREIGVEILKIYKTDFSHEIKEDNSPVTIADHLSNKMLMKGISKFNYEVISEEIENNFELTSKKTWIIDPLDGTKNFVNKTDDFAIMIGLIENYVPVLGLVYSPVSKLLYYAVKDEGSYLIDEKDEITKLKVSDVLDLTDCRMLTGYSTFSEIDREIAEIAGIKKFISMGSIGLKLGFIAEGKGDAYFFNKDVLGLWDLIGPMVILEEAGGEVFQNNGEEFDFKNLKDYKLRNGLVATNTKLSEDIKAILKENLKN